MIKRLSAVLVLIGAILIAAPARGEEHASSAIQLGQNVRLEPAESVSIYDLWNFIPVVKVRDGVTIVDLYVMDPEAGGGALVVVGGEGTGVQPVAFRIYGGDNGNYRIVKSTARDPAQDSFTLTVGQRRFPLVVRHSDAHVFVSGHDLGAVQ